MYRVVCLNRAKGCPCYERMDRRSPVVERLFHYQAIYNPQKLAHGWSRLQLQEGMYFSREPSGEARRCYFPGKRLRRKPYDPIVHSRFQDLDHTPLPLRDLIELPPALGSENTERAENTENTDKPKESDVRDYLDDSRRHSLGKFWPTFYHQALEDYRPGETVSARSPEGRVVMRASREFLRQVIWEGSGIAKDGQRIRYVGGKWHYRVYSDAHWGHGAAEGYHLYPYRSLAVNFPGVCGYLRSGATDAPGGDATSASSDSSALAPTRAPTLAAMSKSCRPEDVHGLLVYSERIARAEIPMDGGRVHDGYFCLVDTGAPYYIRPDRVDIFVGAHGGGNPYLPPQRRFNRLLDGGIKPVVPWDWRLWSARQRKWCETKRESRTGAVESCTHDYHTVALHKHLDLQLVIDDETNRLVRCGRGRRGDSPIQEGFR